MSKATAQLNDYRQSPRKVRLVANLIRGKKVSDAIELLQFTTKRASSPLVKLIQSAEANAKNNGIDENELFVEEITVDGGKILYRRRARARGSAFAIRKRTSHVTVVLGDKVEKKEDKAVKKAAPKKAAPKAKAPVKKTAANLPAGKAGKPAAKKAPATKKPAAAVKKVTPKKK